MTGLAGEVALVTGAGRRVGREVALELARAGAHVVVHVNRSVEEGEETVQAVRELDVRAALVRADQTDVGEIQRACAEAEEALGPVSILVNNAATWPRVPIDEVTPEDFDSVVAENLRGPFFWARTLGVSMRERGAGAIVSIADCRGDDPEPDAVAYGIAKAGILAMTHGLARALAPEVRVNAIGPGPVLFPDVFPADQRSRIAERTLLKRAGSAADVARSVRHLCESPYITGAFLPVDGGYRFGG